MSKAKFTSKDLLSQLRTCPQLAYEFTTDEVLGEVKRFLTYISYELKETVTPDEPKVKPDFYAIRKETDLTHEIMGIVRHDMTEAVDGITALDTIKNQFGDNIDFVMALPPVNERYLIDFMCMDNYKWLHKIKKERYMIWLCNPKERSIWPVFGAPRDKHCNDYFKHIGGLEMLFNMPYRREAKEMQRELLDE